MYNLKQLLIISGCLIAGACTSHPPILSPSKALVSIEQVDSNKLVPNELNSFLNHHKVEESVNIGKLEIILGKPYISALGQSCRQLFVREISPVSSANTKFTATASVDINVKRISKRIACQADPQAPWRLIPAIIQQINNKNLFTR